MSKIEKAIDVICALIALCMVAGVLAAAYDTDKKIEEMKANEQALYVECLEVYKNRTDIECIKP